jgi:hypothetical protein
MKKIVSLITMAAVLVVSTPAFADNRQRDYRWGNDRNVHSPYRGQHQWQQRQNRRGGVSTEGAIAIGIGALILGSAIANNNNRRRNNEVVVVERYRQQPQQVCQDVVQYDYYGNPYVAGRNCWYQ